MLRAREPENRYGRAGVEPQSGRPTQENHMLKHLTIPEIENISALAELAAGRDSDEPLDWHASNHVDRIHEHRRRKAPLLDAIARLSFEARMELMALMWIGRGDPLTFEGAVHHARRTTRSSDAAYIAAKS